VLFLRGMALCRIVHAYSAKPRNKTQLILQTIASPSLAVAVSTPPPNLEKYVFGQSVEVPGTIAVGRNVEIKQMVDGNSRNYLSISGTLDQSLADLLA
jgi:hypothetical protein